MDTGSTLIPEKHALAFNSPPAAAARNFGWYRFWVKVKYDSNPTTQAATLKFFEHGHCKLILIAFRMFLQIGLVPIENFTIGGVVSDIVHLTRIFCHVDQRFPSLSLVIEAVFISLTPYHAAINDRSDAIHRASLGHQILYDNVRAPG